MFVFVVCVVVVVMCCTLVGGSYGAMVAVMVVMTGAPVTSRQERFVTYFGVTHCVMTKPAASSATLHSSREGTRCSIALTAFGASTEYLLRKWTKERVVSGRLQTTRTGTRTCTVIVTHTHTHTRGRARARNRKCKRTDKQEQLTWRVK
jgi:hypothetical protein